MLMTLNFFCLSLPLPHRLTRKYLPAWLTSPHGWPGITWSSTSTRLSYSTSPIEPPHFENFQSPLMVQQWLPPALLGTWEWSWMTSWTSKSKSRQRHGPAGSYSITSEGFNHIWPHTLTQLLIQAMVISQLDYCNSLLTSLPACVIQPLQLIQNAAAHLVFNLPKFSHVTPLLRSLHWLPVAARIRFKVLTLAYAAGNKTAPHYLQDIIQAYTPTRPLRSAATGHLAHPASRATVSRSSPLQSFSTLAPQWWNDLPIPIRPAPSLPIFHRSLKTHLFTLYLDSSSGVS